MAAYEKVTQYLSEFALQPKPTNGSRRSKRPTLNLISACNEASGDANPGGVKPQAYLT
jgi:hypothetical protein